MTSNTAVREGYIPFRGFKTWFRVVGDHETPGKLPLLALHGGPGACHDYLASLEAMSATGRRVNFSDQLGWHSWSLSEPERDLCSVALVVDEAGTGSYFLGVD